MSKVIVERPRQSRPGDIGSAYPRGSLKARWAPHLEDAPRLEAMGRGYGDKSLNENLRPLVRYLRKQVGRPWNKVHSEIAAHVSCTSAVQKHVLDHLRDFVERHAIFVDGRPMRIGWRGLEPIQSRGSRWAQFYVCPRTGLLRLAPIAPRKQRRGATSGADRRVLAEDRELRRIDGIWYEIALAPIPRDPDARAACFDVIERVHLAANVLTARERANPHPVWPRGLYARGKRQLDSRAIARHALAEGT